VVLGKCVKNYKKGVNKMNNRNFTICWGVGCAALALGWAMALPEQQSIIENKQTLQKIASPQQFDELVKKCQEDPVDWQRATDSFVNIEKSKQVFIAGQKSISDSIANAAKSKQFVIDFFISKKIKWDSLSSNIAQKVMGNVNKIEISSDSLKRIKKGI
jgi:hypothetical protein